MSVKVGSADLYFLNCNSSILENGAVECVEKSNTCIWRGAR